MRWAIALLVLSSAVGCGARSGLEVEDCGDAGSRACRNACGEGIQLCLEGRWQPCQVPPTELPCDNVCGAGNQSCIEGALGVCQVPPTQVACENVCGSGLASCADGVVGTCDVPPADVTCENTCGVGTASCVGGVVGECEVSPIELACENACGEGLLLCVDDAAGPCETPPAERPCSTPCGEGVQQCAGGTWGRCSADVPRPPVLSVRVRDFLASHPDFEDAIGSDLGIVQPILDSDDKPVYAGLTPTTHGRMAFDQWYRDVAGVNLGTAIDLELTPSPGDEGLFVFDDSTFFPIDDMLFGNEGRSHNFHFTLEASTEFVYQGGEIFRFRGDDDVWVFINRRLAIDLGGVHGTQEATVNLDAIASRHALVVGERHPIHLFFAERHTTASTFTVETTVADMFRCE